MTMAIYLQCGAQKWRAFNPCKECGFTPQTEDELAYSIAMSDHYFDQATLEHIGSHIRVGKPPKLDPISKEMLLKTIREGGLFNMKDFGTTQRKNESIGLLGRFFGKRQENQLPLVEKPMIDGRGLKVAIIADRLYYPIELIGQNSSLWLG